MNDSNENMVPKVHPATRAVEPEDPMNLHGIEVPGEPEIMLRMLVEDFARMGYGLNDLLALARDPFYHALHGVWLRYGDDELRLRVAGILSRVGVMRVRTVCAPDPASLVQINLNTHG
jgi:hypothetical protein